MIAKKCFVLIKLSADVSNAGYICTEFCCINLKGQVRVIMWQLIINREETTLLKIPAEFYTSRHILDICVSTITHANVFSAILKITNFEVLLTEQISIILVTDQLNPYPANVENRVSS